MIVSHKYKVIFVHCRKVAGSSIKVAFARFLGDHDIVIGSWNEILRSGASLNRAATKCLRRPRPLLLYGIARLARKSHGEAINIAIKSHYSGRLSINPPHPTSLEAEAYFGDAWKSYRKFAFVRNPFDRLASDYYWRFRATGKQITFAQYLRLLEIRDYRNGIIHPGAAYNWEMIANGQDIVVDLVGRYENLSQDLGIICKTLGLPLLRLGSSEKVNNANRNYGELYRAVEIATVERICANELHAFGYEFPYK